MGAVATVFGVFNVNAVGGGVLADDQQFFHAIVDQPLGFAHHRMGGAALQAATHVGDDAELALVIAALGDFQIAEMPRGERDTGGRQQVNERIGRRRHGEVDRVQNLLVLVRTGDGEDAGVMLADVIRLGAQTARHDHAAILGQRLADGVQTLGLGAVQKAAGVHNHRIRAGIIRRDRIAFGAQAREDPLRVHQCLGATEADHANGGLTGAFRLGEGGARCQIGADVRRICAHALAIIYAGGFGNLSRSQSRARWISLLARQRTTAGWSRRTRALDQDRASWRWSGSGCPECPPPRSLRRSA